MDTGIRRGLLFYRRQHPNFKTLNVRTTLGTFLGNLTQPYNQIYARELGASPVELGYLSSLGSAFAAALALPAGFLVDRCGRKRLYVIGSASGILTPLFYLVARSWIWIVPAFISSYVMIALRESAFQAMYAGAVRSRDRGRAFGIGSTLAALPVIAAPLVAVQIMGNPERVTTTSVRPLYLIQLIGIVLLFAYVVRFLVEESRDWVGLRDAFASRDFFFFAPFVGASGLVCLALGLVEKVDPVALIPSLVLIGFSAFAAVATLRRRRASPPRGEASRELGALLGLPGVKAWLAMKGIGSAAMGLANPFWLVFAAYVVGVGPVGLALMVSLRTLGQLVSGIPWGVASDRVGRKFTLLAGRAFMHVGILCFILASRQWTLILGYALMGIADGSASVWTVIRMELVPSGARGSMASMDQLVWYFPVILSATIGGIVYSISPRMIFVLCLLIDAGIRMPLVAFGVPETLKSKRAGKTESGPGPKSG